MDPLDLELQKAFASTQPLPPAQVDALSRRVLDAFARKQRGLSRILVIYHVALALAMFAMIALFFSLSDLKQCILLAVGILMAVAGLVVIKLWFWTMHTKFATLREIKLLQLAVADLRAAQPPSPQTPAANSAAESMTFPQTLPAPAASRKSWWLVLAPLWLLAAAGVIYFGWLRSPDEPRNVVPYFEKTLAAAEATPGTQWQQSFEVSRQTMRFYPQLISPDKHARLWISVGPEGQEPDYTGTIEPIGQMSFGQPNPGKYLVKCRVINPGSNMQLRIGGIDEPISSMSFLPSFFLLLSAAIALAIPLIWLQSRWLQRLDPESTR